ncbi:MAG: hypothetical protein Q7S58_08625 [Candidatus Binatus sp.]|uniref:hypothetical protein n=1 Tax=Candidatus Binatus sp. TaxID=2811406 RepID=UPI00271CB3AC|nr:hypothetical protein [Candidatus Binatus sp.]MDO8432457.1 hypothetical protein [Candidatus Binatus sp.]
MDDETIGFVKSVLSDFIGITGQPVANFAVVSLRSHILLDYLVDPADAATIRDYIDIACLSGLSGREFLGRAEPYCNSDCFLLYERRFDSMTGVRAPMFRRRDNTPFGPAAGPAMRVHVPVHAAAVPRASLDESFFRALASFREIVVTSSDSERWTAWQEAIYCFNQANTDNESMSEHLEWVLMSSALERILGAPPNADAVAKRFVEAIVPERPQLYFDLAILRDWVREFYRLRGDFAHGRIRSRKLRRWESWRHLLFGAIAFPLLTKALLEREKAYVFTENDHCQLAALAWMLREALHASAAAKSWHQYVSDQLSLIRRSPTAS